jgi:hypothetical protein
MATFISSQIVLVLETEEGRPEETSSVTGALPLFLKSRHPCPQQQCSFVVNLKDQIYP